MGKDYILGVDLGQSQDFTALVVLEREERETGRVTYNPVLLHAPTMKNVPRTLPVTENHYAVRHLERLPIGTPYPEQVATVKALHERLSAQEARLALVVDQTGVGCPVLDMMRRAQLSPYAVTITGGDAVTREGRDYRVPKRDLVSTVQVLLQSKRLSISKGLEHAQTLVKELLAFKVSINIRGHDSYGNDEGPWRESPHDDMVLAVALAAWYGEQQRVVQTTGFYLGGETKENVWET